MKAVVIGAGVSGLTAGALLAKDGAHVTVIEQNDFIGGVTSLYKQGEYSFEQGPLLLDHMMPEESAWKVLQELGITLETERAQRSISMPGFLLSSPEEYAGPDWRRQRLKELFPDESAGIDKYYKFYSDVMQASRVSEESGKLGSSMLVKLKTIISYMKIKNYINMSADEVLREFFKSEDLRAVFSGILADVCVAPSEFYALGVPFFNVETAFDKRIPLTNKKGEKIREGYCYIRGGVQRLAEELARVITENGGEILTGTQVEKVLVENECVQGVIANEKEYPAQLVVGSGGGREMFLKLVGREHLSVEYERIINSFMPMEAVFMLHLGVDYDPLQYQKDALCYYYRSSDIDGAIKRLRSGIYHEGEDGFLIYVPSAHAPEFAPEGKHCVTIYTVCPDTLAEGTWQEKKDYYAKKLITLAEEYLPGLGQHITQMSIITPEYFRKIMHTDKCSFGGVVPKQGLRNPSHMTPVSGLFFVGQQSQSAGGVSAVLLGAHRAYLKYMQPICREFADE